MKTAHQDSVLLQQDIFACTTHPLSTIIQMHYKLRQ